MRTLAITTFVVCAVSCSLFYESNPFDAWPDDHTSAVFMDQEPTCEERQMWYDVSIAVTQVWGSEPEPMYVWFVRSQDQLIYHEGEVKMWPSGLAGMVTWGDGLPPNLYVGVFHDPWVARNIMCHEMTHVYWRLRDHDSAEFKARQLELLKTVWALDGD